jgi:hypothetical protein
LRLRAGLSARQTDDLAGKAPGHVAMLEARPHVDLYVSTALAYARIFGATLDYLATGAGRPPTEAQLREAVAAARSLAQHRPATVRATDRKARGPVRAAAARPSTRPRRAVSGR